MNLSPFDMKNLLHHILSGKEFGVERSGKSHAPVNVFRELPPLHAADIRTSTVGHSECGKGRLLPEGDGQSPRLKLPALGALRPARSVLGELFLPRLAQHVGVVYCLL